MTLISNRDQLQCILADLKASLRKVCTNPHFYNKEITPFEFFKDNYSPLLNFEVLTKRDSIMATRPSVQLHSTRRKDKDENVDAETVGQENVSGFTRFRTVIVLAIIFACFALIYPRFIHPAIKQAFGSKTEKKSEHFEDKFLPPRFQHRPITPHPGHPPSNMQKR